MGGRLTRRSRVEPHESDLLKLSIVSLLLVACASRTPVSPAVGPQDEVVSGFEEDWADFREIVTDYYAYRDRPGFDAQAWLDLHEVAALSARTPIAFADQLQSVARRFHDPHFNAGPYDDDDYSVVPTGTDLYGVFDADGAVVVDVMLGGAADVAGVRPGWRIVRIDDLSPDAAARRPFPKAPELDVPTLEYGLQLALSGKRHQTRVVAFTKPDGTKVELELAATYGAVDATREGPVVTARRVDTVGVIRLNNSLGNDDTIAAFDAAIEEQAATTALILDLRGTPSGGNTTIARSILGHFVDEPLPYQVHEFPVDLRLHGVERRAVEYVLPRGYRYTKPVVVLCGRWSGSMGEGLVIGMDAIGADAVFGSEMADLLGGLHVFRLEQSQAFVEIGVESLFHVDGTPREDFVPAHLVSPADRAADGSDAALTAALEWLSSREAESP